MDYDTLVIGGGLGGMESSLKLADMGYKVLLVEKKPSVGGTMVLLSKVFPTLDCASCISTPKMAATQHHPNIDVMIYSEVEEIKRNDHGRFQVRINKKSTFVKPDLCTGCQQCETACNVAVPDQYNFDMVSRRAAHIVYPQAVPKKAVIERKGSSPCLFTCPAGVKAHGYVALTRTGKYDEAFNLILEDTPLVGSLGRACFAPCEEECTRGSLEGPVPIRMIKRWLADRYYNGHAEPEIKEPEERNGKKVAIVGSGPAGLTCAFHLAKAGYQIKIFEARSIPGGMLSIGIPAYRLPKDVVARDIQNVTALGVEIATGVRVSNLADLTAQGFEAIFIAAGLQGAVKLGVPGDDLPGVLSGVDFLQSVNLDEAIRLGQRVAVIGGGNVAIDAARTALRLGAGEVAVIYRRTRTEMPAEDQEIADAEEEGVRFKYLAAPIEICAHNGWASEMRLQKMCLGEPDATGRRRPVAVPGDTETIAVDAVINAIGQAAELNFTEGLDELTGANGNLAVDPETLTTPVPGVFAGGDLATGPSTIAMAAGQGKKSGLPDRPLPEGSLDTAGFDCRLPVVDRVEVIARQQLHGPFSRTQEKLAAPR